MLQGWKDIGVILDGSPAGHLIGRQAASLARANKAHLIGLFGISREPIASLSEGFVRGPVGMTAVVAQHSERAEQKVLAASRQLRAISEEYGVSTELRVTWRDSAEPDLPLHSLQCDLLVAALGGCVDLPHAWSPAHLLAHTRRPLLLIPCSWGDRPVGSRVLIGWNASLEASRAVADAMPFIETAHEVSVLMIDAHLDPHRFGQPPGEELVAHLVRHGVNCRKIQAASSERPKADVIRQQAAHHDCNLIVLGAYSRSKTSEILFGGVTRSFLEGASVPLLMSR